MTQEVKTVIEISHKPSMIDKPDKQTLNGDINSQWSMIINTNTSFFFLMNVHTLIIKKKNCNEKIWNDQTLHNH